MINQSNILRGKVYVLGDNIDTDQILSAEYLKVNPATEEGRKELATLAMCGLPEGSIPFVDKNTGKAKYDFILAKNNFGCGSSREHAVVSLGASGVKAVIALSFARIFFRNCVSTGELMPITIQNSHFLDCIKTGDMIEINLETNQIVIPGETLNMAPIGELANIVSAGGLFAYARQNEKM
ncbi:3-isopropylmalate dehydratase [Providencia stuartii]|uniref:LeuD/DmdB family oxidoreductase small subunit n=1 Tax=Providencia stuartii TaxID=588 RepID=UPI0034E61390